MFTVSSWLLTHLKTKSSLYKVRDLDYSPVRDIKKKHEFTNVLHKGQRAFLTHFLWFIIYYKKMFKSCFFIIKVSRNILRSFKLVNSWFRFFMSRTSYMLSVFKPLGRPRPGHLAALKFLLVSKFILCLRVVCFHGQKNIYMMASFQPNNQRNSYMDFWSSLLKEVRSKN